MRQTSYIILLLISTWSYSQNNSGDAVFKKIIHYEIQQDTIGIYISCEKSKAFFDKEDLKEQTVLEVPEKILNELEENATKSNHGSWDSELITELNYGSDFIKSMQCLSLKEAQLLYDKKKKRQHIITLSEPVFDNDYENCVISVSFQYFTGSAHGYSYFLKKTDGVWTVIAYYDAWIS
ncbi:hypothetical protein [Cellulophaga algicola]|nr:hypothetical protein [Cellulophaga algicola]